MAHCRRERVGLLTSAKRASLARLLVTAAVIATLVLFAFLLLSDLPELIAALGQFNPLYAVPALALASFNYAIRFARWHYYLRRFDIALPLRRSATVFMTGLAMSVTPGKIGEMIKCVMLQDSDDVSMTRTAPAVVAERFLDVVAVVLLMGTGVLRYTSGRALFGAGLVIVMVAFIVLNRSPELVDGIGTRLAKRLLPGRSTDWARDSAESFRALLHGRALFVGLALGLIAWSAECLAFWVVIAGFGAETLSVSGATFIYAAATLAGALSMLPGGLGATEATMAAMLLSVGLTMPTSSAATVITRAVTLWWGVLVGSVAYGLHLRTSRRALAETEEIVEEQDS